jgi:hypothetical protein
MKLKYENNNVIHSIDLVGKTDIEKVLNDLDPVIQPYVILEDENDDFIQCAGSKNNLVVEIRLHNGNSFKHYILGKKEENKVWHTINCKVGPIRVLGHEDLTLKHAIELFNNFYFLKDIIPTYNKRNITKQFNKG